MKRTKVSLRRWCAGVAAMALAAAVTPLVAQSPSPVTPGVTGWLSAQTIPADIVVVIDESGGLSSQELSSVRSLVRAFVGSQSLGPVQIGLVGFGVTAHQIQALSTSSATLLGATATIQSAGATRCESCGISLANQILTNSGRAGVAHVILLVSRGTSTDPPGALASAVAQAQAGNTILALGLGATADLTELGTVASPVPGVQTVVWQQAIDGELAAAGPVSRMVADTLGETTATADATCDTPATLDLELQGYNTTQTAPIDVVLVLDESGSISAASFQQLRNFAASVANSLTFGPNQAQLGIVQFSGDARQVLPLTSSQAYALNAINALYQRGGATCIPCGLQMAANVFNGTNGNRPNVNRFTILVTDGLNNVNDSQLPSTSALLRSMSVVLTVGVGSSVSGPQLQSIASSIPGVQTTFLTPDFASLSSVVDSLTSIIAVPAVQNVQVTVQLAAPFVFSGPPTTTSGSAVTGPDTTTWTLPQLGADLQRIRMALGRSERVGGTRAPVASVTYTDAAGHVVAFNDATYAIHGCPAAIALDPPTASILPGGSHTVTATVVDDFNDPVSSEPVQFGVSAGPDAGASGTGTTDGSGQAPFSFTNGGTPGFDTIDASLPNAPLVAAASASLEVTRLTPVVAVTGGTFVYDGLPHAATASATGTGGVDLGAVTVTYDGGPTPPVNVGTYAVEASYAGDATYLPGTASATITITPAPLTIKADDATKVYGAPVPALTATFTGLVNGETPAVLATPVVLSTGASAASNVGTYVIQASGATAANYSITFQNGALSVTPAPLVITANDATMVEGAAVPPLTASYAGFVNGDTPASLDTPVVLTTTATPASPAGAYPIVASGASDANYTIAFVNGTLTVTSLRAEKQAVRALLAGLLPTGDTTTDQTIQRALDHLDGSLDPQLWQDASHLTAKGQKVFEEEKKTVHELLKIDDPSADITSAIQRLVAVDRQLAYDAIGDATAAGGNAADLGRAQQFLDDGDTLAGQGNFDNAIESYKEAWNKAQQSVR